MLQCVAVCCSVLQRVVCHSTLQSIAVCWSVLQRVTACFNVFQCVPVCGIGLLSGFGVQELGLRV